MLTVEEKEEHKKSHQAPPKPPPRAPPITRQQVKNNKADEDDQSSGSTEEMELYQCRLCPPGRLFTARERDNHREFHRRQGQHGIQGQRRRRRQF